ncbi:MAG TPA: hypothetical protein VK917_08705, partial [Ilumatobacter sp.]|nr:hypothetical protein [Ilumatobacter sp.]
MGRGSRRAAPPLVLGVLVMLGALVGHPAGASTPPDGRDVVLTDVGAGWTLVDEGSGAQGGFTRAWRGALGELSIHGFPVSDPPGVATLFEGLRTIDAGLEVVPAPAVTLGVWLVPPGGAVGEFGFNALMFASRAHIFTLTLTLTAGAEVDGPALALELAHRQIDAAGGPPTVDAVPEPRDAEDATLFPLLPDRPPSGYGLARSPMSLAGRDELALDESLVPEVVEFVNDRTRSVVRAWAGDVLTLGIGITEFPYELFA